MLSISMHRQNFVKIHSFILKILRENEILMLFKGHNSVINPQSQVIPRSHYEFYTGIVDLV